MSKKTRKVKLGRDALRNLPLSALPWIVGGGGVDGDGSPPAAGSVEGDGSPP